jgi:hypothetical protein
VLSRNISGWGNQFLSEHVFLSHQEICISKWGKPVFKGIFLFNRLTKASGGNLRFFFVLTRNISEWGKLVYKEKFVCAK